MTYPKVLILGETFTETDGGGITLSNLFADWPRERLANAVYGNKVAKIAPVRACSRTYSLGEKEAGTVRGASAFRRKFPSGEVDPNTLANPAPQEGAGGRKSYRATILRIVIAALHRLGIYHSLFKLNVSEEFLAWVDDFEPEFIYAQFNTIEMMQFLLELEGRTDSKLVVHMMDDWPSTIVRNGLFRRLWERRVHRQLMRIFQRSYRRLTISSAMSAEYKRRYGYEFVHFHNPIDLDFWGENRRTDYSSQNSFKILYAGRIGLGTEKALAQVVQAIDLLVDKGERVSLGIQSSNSDPATLAHFARSGAVTINPIVPYAELPRVFSAPDLLVLPYDFDAAGRAFIKYSMPTKASEYMATAVPILVYASADTAIARDASENGWAEVVSDDDLEVLMRAIATLMHDSERRRELGSTAVSFAEREFDATRVRARFRSVFSPAPLTSG